MNRILYSLLLLACFLVVAGCGEPTGSLTGKVTYNDKPVANGTVVFMGAEKTVHVPIDENGTYTSDKVPVGDVKVAVMPAPRPPGSFMPKGAKIPDSAKDTPQGKMYLEAQNSFVAIPDNLQDPTKSGQTVKVTGGAQTYDIALKGS